MFKSRGINATAFLVMAIITALTAQKRKNDRLNVHIDGEYAFSLTLETSARLTVGQFLSADEIKALQVQDSFERAKQSALRFLSYRPRSAVEVERNLRGKGIDPVVIERVISHLHQAQLLDDLAFGQYWVEQRESFKPRSRMAIRHELRQKGLGREAIDEAVAEVDEEAAAYRAGAKQAQRWARLPQDEFRVKLAGFLQRRGFGYGVIGPAVTKIWQELSSDDNDPTV